MDRFLNNLASVIGLFLVGVVVGVLFVVLTGCQ